MSERSPSLAAILEAALSARLARLHVSLPAVVMRYDAARQAIDAQPIIRQSYEDEEGARSTERVPVVTDVPVVFPGSGPFTMTFPIAVGDTVLLVFSEQALEKWLTYGGIDIDPLDDRRNHLSDAIAIPGLRPFSDPVPNATTTHMQIGHAEGAQLFINEGTIEARTQSGTAVALATLADVEAVQGAVDGHEHLYVPSGGGTALTTNGPSVPAPSGTSVFKAE